MEEQDRNYDRGKLLVPQKERGKSSALASDCRSHRQSHAQVVTWERGKEEMTRCWSRTGGAEGRGGEESETQHRHSYGLTDLLHHWPLEHVGGAARNLTQHQNNSDIKTIPQQNMCCVRPWRHVVRCCSARNLPKNS